MKNIRLFLLVIGQLILLHLAPSKAVAQEQEIQQLILNIEKLAEFKKILQNLYEGYQVLETGYNKVKDITSGNFELHELFLDGLYLVSPQVKQYHKVAGIIDYQKRLVSGYKNAFQLFKKSQVFSDGELDYLGRVYGGLLEQSLQGLEALLLVLTPSSYRMSDQERLSRIDRLFEEMQRKWEFLRSFNQSNQLLALQRIKEKQELDWLQQMHHE